MSKKWDKLQNSMLLDPELKDSLVFLHPEEDRDYTDEEIIAQRKKNGFETHLYMTLRPHFGDSVFLRSYHSDNHKHKTGTFNFVRDYLKASSSTKSYTAAKSTLTRLLTIMFDSRDDEYLTFATTMASALSKNAKNIDFEQGAKGDQNAFYAEGDDEDELRTHLCVLMHIIFTKMKNNQFMIADEGSNVYRLFHCRIMTTTDRKPVLYALFSFLLQCCLGGYVFVQVYKNFKEGVYYDFEGGGGIKNIPYLPLAFLTSIYSAILILPAIREIPDAFDIFNRRFGILLVMDFIVNAILPTILLFTGFFVIWGQESFIESVLNTAALLFIPEIDDQLPSLLGFRESSIIKNFLISEAIKEFDSLHCENQAERTRLYNKIIDEGRSLGMGVQFGDHFLTNVAEQPSSPAEGNLFLPYQVRKGKTRANGDQIDPSYFINKNCLIKKITWKYTIYGPAKNTSNPRIGYLKLVLLSGEEISYERPNEDLIQLGEEHTLEGVYLITTFQMSNDILRLRVCGSKTAANFKTACEYYTLWPMDAAATRILDDEISKERYKPNRSIKQVDLGRGVGENVV